jgi:hypothetical protein
MSKFNDTKGAPTKRPKTNDETLDSATKNGDVYSRELEQPNRSNATPDIPQEMPIREMK